MNDSSTMSVKDAANERVAPQALPNFDAQHDALMTKEKYGDLLDYLVSERKFSIDVLKKHKIGAATFRSKVEGHIGEEVICYVMPYYDAKGNPVFFKARTLPVEDREREFFAPAGREASLFNESVLHKDMDEVVIVEGEADCLSLLSQGYTNVVGVPGAAVKKAMWIERLEKLAPKAIYICYDRDKPGQDNAKDMAIRIGMEKVQNIKLPEFERVDGQPGKDLNEFFSAGHSLDAFNVLKEDARAFDVEGVVDLASVLADLERDIEENGMEPKYKPHWEALRKKVGGFDDGDLVGWMAEGKIGKTTAALNMLHAWSANEGHTCFMYCNEMSPKRMVRKWASHVTQTNDNPADPNNAEVMKGAVIASYPIARAMKGDLLFGYTTGKKTEQVFDTIRQAVKRYGVKIVCFDNLHLMVRSLENSQNEISRITKDFKALAMELQILIVLIIQPKKIQDGHILTGNDGSGSGAISKDVDYMIIFHRNRVAGQLKSSDLTGFMETEESFEPQMYCKADLTRYSNGGWCTLYMDGPKSTVRDIGSGECPTHQSSAVIQVEKVAA